MASTRRTSDGHLNLPYDVPANEFMNIEGQKFSKSRNWAVWIPDILERYDPDAIRYYITMTVPGNPRLRLELGGVRHPQQQRTAGGVGQSGQPRADLRHQEF